MDNYTFNEKPPQDYEKELKSLNSKILTMSGYIIAMRSGTMQDFQQIKNDLKNIIQSTHNIKTIIIVSMLTTWFIALFTLTIYNKLTFISSIINK